MGLLKHVQNRSVLHKYICMTAGGQKITTYIFTYPKSDEKKVQNGYNQRFFLLIKMYVFLFRICNTNTLFFQNLLTVENILIIFLLQLQRGHYSNISSHLDIRSIYVIHLLILDRGDIRFLV